MQGVDKTALLSHATEILGEMIAISDPFSAGEVWCCFELVAASGRLIIARVRIPTHQRRNLAIDEQAEFYSIECEVATMKFLQDNNGKFSLPFPKLYAYENPKSKRTAEVGVPYMLVEGFYGNTLQDMEVDVCKLSVRPKL